MARDLNIWQIAARLVWGNPSWPKRMRPHLTPPIGKALAPEAPQSLPVTRYGPFVYYLYF